MIVTPNFVFLHLHKSGGTFVNLALMRFVPEARQVGYHLPRSMIPAQYADLPVLGLVRNPWSYYVSWYTFQRARPQPNALYRALSDDGALGFAGTVTNMLALGTDEALLQRVVAALPAAYGNQGLNLPGFALAPIRSTGLGFYSYLYQYMYGPRARDVVVGRMEQLRQEFPAMMEQIGQPVSPQLRAYFAEAAAVNTSQHGAYHTHYDAALAQQVARCDQAIIERHGYRFDE